MSTPDTPSAPSFAVATLSDAQYHEAVQAALARIERTIDGWLEGDVIDIDAARTGGMLTLSLPDRSQLIVNAQPPLQELWLAARRGGFHFKMDAGGAWRDTRTAQEFFELLSACASEQGRVTLRF
ncbi:MAG: iron donor protein CyaY [Proteobacteria bacterium]|uniref:iron donor protein CyaY n=1 Tax=Aquabacterium sp. TaxID=1872578 RepID=UPI0035C7391C|nr:iron donor protein CyaY [Pseudomonadota bacterium]